jgi:membrane protein
VTSAALWQLLQWLGQWYVQRVITRASEMNGTFALVLGLIGFLFAASVMVVVGLEVTSVVARQLYPRALLTPFTDNVELTRADRAAYTQYAVSQRHKGFQTVSVQFIEDREPADPDPRADQPSEGSR